MSHTTLDLDKLDPGEIRAQLDDLDRQARALRVLLRAALARQKKVVAVTPGPTAEEGSDAT